MRLLHPVQGVVTAFDEENLVPDAGLVPVLALAGQAGLHAAVTDRVTVPGSAGANAAHKVGSLVAGMAAGADSIDDMARLRHGGTLRVLGGSRAPSTLGTHLRAYTFGHVRQLDSVAATVLRGLARLAPLLPDVGSLAYLDVDDTIKQVYGYAKQGAGYGYSGVKGINALIATVSTPSCAPVIVGTRLRRGPAASVRGAGKFVADALATATSLGAGPGSGSGGAGLGTGGHAGLVVVRADSAYYAHDVVAAAGRAGAALSITARMNPAVRRGIDSIRERAWTPIRYPNAIWDEPDRCWISEAEIAEVAFTAFTSRPIREHVTARLIVRRVRRPTSTNTNGASQGELFAAYRYHAVFTDSPLVLAEAEAAHRDHAIVEQVIADLKAGALAHLPSGSFTANAAWLVLAAITHNLLRAAGTATGSVLARARTTTIRDRLVTVPARLASSARRLLLHLPARWSRHDAFEQLCDTVHITTHGPPPALH